MHDDLEIKPFFILTKQRGGEKPFFPTKETEKYVKFYFTQFLESKRYGFATSEKIQSDQCSKTENFDESIYDKFGKTSSILCPKTT